MNLLKVADYMNRYPVTFSVDMPVELAVERLIQGHQLGGPVICEQRKVIGFISEQDCLARMLDSVYHDQQQACVTDVMSKDVLTVRPYDCLVDLAQTMLQRKPKIYPVVDDDGFLLGLITRRDVLMAIDHELHSHYQQAG